MPIATKVAVVESGPFKVQFTLDPALTTRDVILYPDGNPPLNRGPTSVQLATAEPTLLLAVRVAKLEALTAVKLAATEFVAFCLALVLRLIKRGTAITAIMAMMVNTIINSISENPNVFFI